MDLKFSRPPANFHVSSQEAITLAKHAKNAQNSQDFLFPKAKRKLTSPDEQRNAPTSQFSSKFPKEKLVFSPETLKTSDFHVPVIKARLPHAKLSNFQRTEGNCSENVNVFSKTTTNFHPKTQNNEEDSSEITIPGNKLAFSEVFETSVNRDFAISPEKSAWEPKKQAFSAKIANSHENAARIEPFSQTFKRKSAIALKTSPNNPKRSADFLNFSPENKKKLEIRFISPEMIKRKDELLEKIQQKSAEKCEISGKKKNFTKTRLTEAFQKAEIYNDKVVRQINFEKENQEEEKNFQELYEALNNIN